MNVLIGSLRSPSGGRPDAAGRRPPALRTDGPIAGALALCWLAVMLAHLRLPYPSDQLNYMSAAGRFPDPLANSSELHQVTRFGLIIPARLAIAVFGYSEAGYHTVPLLASLSLLLGTYAVGTLLFSRWVGAAAAITVVAATPVFYDSTDLLPDVLATGLFTVALAVAVAVRQERLPARWPVLLGIGFLLGWSYLVREFIVFLWPLAAVLLHRRVRWRGLLWLVAPVAVLFLGETLLCWALYHDPLARLRAVTGHGSEPSTPQIARTFVGKPRRVYLLRLPTILNDYPGGAWLVGLLALTLLGVAARVRRLAVPALWCALLWIPLTLLGGLLDPGAPKLRLQLIRYWFPIFPAFVLGGLGLLWLAARAWTRPRAVAAGLVLGVAALAAGTAMNGWWADPGTRLGGATQLAAFRGWMARQDGGHHVVWTDRRTANLLRIYQHGPFGGLAWHARIARAADGGGPPERGDLVLFFDADRGKLCGICRKYAQLAWGKPVRPNPRWHLVYATRDQVVRVYAV